MRRRYAHDVGFVNGSDALTATGLGMVECIPGDTLGRVPCNEFDRLDNTVDNLRGVNIKSMLFTNFTYLMLNTRVLSLSVLANQKGVHVIVGCLETFDGHTWPDVGEQFERPAESQVERYVTLAN
jgi:hypothetical protein